MNVPEAVIGPTYRALIGAGWLGLLDRLLAGVVHDLNGRASALGGLATLLTMDDDMDMSAHIEDEVGRLSDLAGRLRLLLGDPDGAAEPLVVGDLLPALTTILDAERGVEGGAVEMVSHPGAPPILVNWAAFSRIVLLVLSTVRRGGGPDARTVVSTGMSPEGELELTVEGGGFDTDHGPHDEAPKEHARESLREAVVVQGGRLDGDAPNRMRLRFPSLGQARRAQA